MQAVVLLVPGSGHSQKRHVPQVSRDIWPGRHPPVMLVQEAIEPGISLTGPFGSHFGEKTLKRAVFLLVNRKILGVAESPVTGLPAASVVYENPFGEEIYIFIYIFFFLVLFLFLLFGCNT